MLILVPFIIAGGIMWFVAFQMAPMGYEIPLSRAVAATILMALGDLIAKAFLSPFMGEWYLFAYFIISSLIVMVILRLKFLRSMMAVTVYLLVLAIGISSLVWLRKINRPFYPPMERLFPEFLISSPRVVTVGGNSSKFFSFLSKSMIVPLCVWSLSWSQGTMIAVADSALLLRKA